MCCEEGGRVRGGNAVLIYADGMSQSGREVCPRAPPLTSHVTHSLCAHTALQHAHSPTLTLTTLRVPSCSFSYTALLLLLLPPKAPPRVHLCRCRRRHVRTTRKSTNSISIATEQSTASSTATTPTLTPPLLLCCSVHTGTR